MMLKVSVLFSLDESVFFFYDSLSGRLVQPGGQVCRFGEGAGTEADAAGGLSAGGHQSHDPAPWGLQRLHTGREQHTLHTKSFLTQSLKF